MSFTMKAVCLAAFALSVVGSLASEASHPAEDANLLQVPATQAVDPATHVFKGNLKDLNKKGMALTATSHHHVEHESAPGDKKIYKVTIEEIAAEEAAPAPTPAPTPDPHLHDHFLGAGGLSLQDLGCHVDSDAKLVSDADGNVDAALECPLFSSTEGCAWCPITGMPADSAPKSLTFWMKMSSDSNDAVGIVGFGTTGATNNFLVSLRKSKQLIFGWASTTKYSGLYPPVDEWCHVAFTYDGSMGTFYMRKGGGSVETAEIDVGDLTVPADSTLSLGSEVDHNEGFTGLLSDVRVYSKALTAAEVDQIYAAR